MFFVRKSHSTIEDTEPAALEEIVPCPSDHASSAAAAAAAAAVVVAAASFDLGQVPAGCRCESPPGRLVCSWAVSSNQVVLQVYQAAKLSSVVVFFVAQ